MAGRLAGGIVAVLAADRLREDGAQIAIGLADIKPEMASLRPDDETAIRGQTFALAEVRPDGAGSMRIRDRLLIFSSA